MQVVPAFPLWPPFPGFISETPGAGKTCFFPFPGLDNWATRRRQLRCSGDCWSAPVVFSHSPVICSSFLASWLLSNGIPACLRTSSRRISRRLRSGRKWLASSSSTAATILNERRSTITTSTCHWDTCQRHDVWPLFAIFMPAKYFRYWCCPLCTISSSLIGVVFLVSTPALRFSFNR